MELGGLDGVRSVTIRISEQILQFLSFKNKKEYQFSENDKKFIENLTLDFLQDP